MGCWQSAVIFPYNVCISMRQSWTRSCIDETPLQRSRLWSRAILIVNVCSQSHQRVLFPCPQVCVSHRCASVWTAPCVSHLLRYMYPTGWIWQWLVSFLIVWVKITLGSQLLLITLRTQSIINYIWRYQQRATQSGHVLHYLQHILYM